MTSSNGNIFRVTGSLCGWIPRAKSSDRELWCFLWSAPWINGWVNNRDAGDLRRHRAHYDVIVIYSCFRGWVFAYMKTMKAFSRLHAAPYVDGKMSNSIFCKIVYYANTHWINTLLMFSFVFTVIVETSIDVGNVSDPVFSFNFNFSEYVSEY